jgi:hypothetical protein
MGGDPSLRITDAKITEVKERFPSCARLWDVAMVEKAWPRLAPLLTRSFERANQRERVRQAVERAVAEGFCPPEQASQLVSDVERELRA